MGGWQAVLDRHAELFAELAPGASIALAARTPPRANIELVLEPRPMLLWLRESAGMRVSEGEYCGLKTLGADVLFLPEEGALDAALAHEQPMSELKRGVRDGRMLVMVMRSRNELRERGWSEFFEALGLPFLGTCR
jgi:hypothetical protein